MGMLTVNPDDRDRLIDEIKNALGSNAVVEPDPSNDSVILVTLPKSESDAAQTDLSGFTEVKSVEVRASETTRDEIAGTTDSTVQEDEGPSTTLIALLVALAAFLLVALCAIAVAAAFKKKKMAGAGADDSYTGRDFQGSTLRTAQKKKSSGSRSASSSCLN